MAQGHSVDEYLETIYFLAFPIGEYRPAETELPTLASRVAEMLGVSRASAGEMLKRLEADGLVERGERKEAILTETGRDRAEKAVRKHRIDRKSTRLNSSHLVISYAVFCLKKKKSHRPRTRGPGASVRRCPLRPCSTRAGASGRCGVASAAGVWALCPAAGSSRVTGAERA